MFIAPSFVGVGASHYERISLRSKKGQVVPSERSSKGNNHVRIQSTPRLLRSRVRRTPVWEARASPPGVRKRCWLLPRDPRERFPVHEGVGRVLPDRLRGRSGAPHPLLGEQDFSLSECAGSPSSGDPFFSCVM